MSHVSEMMLATVSNVADIDKSMIYKAFLRRQIARVCRGKPPGAVLPSGGPVYRTGAESSMPPATTQGRNSAAPVRPPKRSHTRWAAFF